MATTLDHFDVLTDRGLKVIPLRQNSKVPLCRGWNRNWDRREARETLMRFPDCNIGILLGDIVDVEGDSLQANLAIQRLVEDYPHPTYRSTRSIHHLFQTPDPELRIFKFNEVEFRGHGHQSVLPPSRHEEVVYRWLTTGFPIPEMPPKLIKFYRDRQNKRAKKIKPGHIRVWCSVCEKQSFIHRTRFHLELEAFQLLCQKWTCQCCRVVDLRPVVRILRKEGSSGVFGCKVGSDWSDFDTLAPLEHHAKMLAGVQ